MQIKLMNINNHQVWLTNCRWLPVTPHVECRDGTQPMVKIFIYLYHGHTWLSSVEKLSWIIKTHRWYIELVTNKAMHSSKGNDYHGGLPKVRIRNFCGWGVTDGALVLDADLTVGLNGPLGDVTDDDMWNYITDFDSFNRSQRYYWRGDTYRRRKWTRTRIIFPPTMNDPMFVIYTSSPFFIYTISFIFDYLVVSARLPLDLLPPPTQNNHKNISTTQLFIKIIALVKRLRSNRAHSWTFEQILNLKKISSKSLL